MNTQTAVIVGTGFSGLAMGILLKQAGIHDFTIFEKADDVGGTWRENHYPGAACDVPSHLYSFSFDPYPDWSHAFAPQGEILAYLQRCARKFDILPHVRFRSPVTAAEFDEPSGTWTVRAGAPGQAQVVRARALILGNGGLHVPAIPHIPGLERFQGARFHSACWDHSYDLRGKRVAVIGTGASAVQIVPAIAPQVAHLTVFQRTPPWIVPRPDRPYGPRERWLLRHLPGLQRLYRAGIYWSLEARGLGFVRAPAILRLIEPLVRASLRKSVPDPDLRRRLTPGYRLGCKRILLSDNYYPALQRSNVALCTTPITEILPRAVRTADGPDHHDHPVDAIVLATGFATAQYLAAVRVIGRGGRELNATWQEAPEAYLGITVAGFPNLFLLMGPNTGLGHNSMIFMIEAQARYALQAIQALRAHRLRSLEVRPPVQAAFNQELQARLRRTVWASGCQSWYLGRDGRNLALWPGLTISYYLRTRRLALTDYLRTPA